MGNTDKCSLCHEHARRVRLNVFLTTRSSLGVLVHGETRPPWEGAEPALVTRPPPPGYPASHVHMWGGTCLPGGERGAAGRGPRPAGGTQVSRTRRGMTAPRKQVTGASHRAASHSKSHGKGTKLPGPAGGHTRGWTPEGPSPPRGGAGAATNAKGR